MLGDKEGTVMEGEHPLGTNTQLETSSSEQESSVERKGSCCEACETLEKILPVLRFFWRLALVWAWPPHVNIVEETPFSFLMQVTARSAQLIFLT